jgi:hypothetical protein
MDPCCSQGLTGSLSNQHETSLQHHWLKHGDCNTNFFLHYASSRRKRNNIKGLVDDDGIRHEDSNTMQSMVHNYFAQLFQIESYEVNDDLLNVVK